MNEYDGIDLHADSMGDDPHAAINVKLYGGSFGVLPSRLEPLGEMAYESVQWQFWRQATDLAHESGYSDVFAEGRSGGWLVPFYQDGMTEQEIAERGLARHAVTRAPMLLSWPGQGRKLGYPRYPDMDEIGERSRFRAFQRRIVAMLDDVPAWYAREAQYLYAETLARVV